VRLKAAELTPSERLGLPVIRNDPRQRGFTQPCPAWNGICTIYDSPHYPRGCDSYKCKLLRELLDESVTLNYALALVDKTKGLIRRVEIQLPKSAHASFRERFVAQVKSLKGVSSREYNQKFMAQARKLLTIVECTFGVTDFFDTSKEGYDPFSR
jgi:hypothetical protein